MGGRGGSGRSSAGLIKVPVVDAKEMADMDLRDAYADVAAIVNQASHNENQGPWVMLERLRTALSVRGWDREKQDREIRRFVRERKAVLGAIVYKHYRTKEDRAAALTMGNDEHDFISFF